MVTAVVTIAAFLIWILPARQGLLVTMEARPEGVMGTTTLLRVVVPIGGGATGRRALAAAEQALREVDWRMSTWVEITELSRFNAVGADEWVKLSPSTLAVLEVALEFAEATGGAFDPTCGPILEVWRRGEEEGAVPSEDLLAEAMGRSGWRRVRLSETSASKQVEGLRVDVGGIAKGWAVDRAVEAMQEAGVRGGLVQCGGDLRVFGESGQGREWRLGVRDPNRPEGSLLPDTLSIAEGAVSTSGNYERFYTIGGRRYSHIIDPRSGRPVDAVPQVTVVASESVVADGWSTALTVLGPDGLGLLPDGVEALMLVREGGAIVRQETPGFRISAR